MGEQEKSAGLRETINSMPEKEKQRRHFKLPPDYLNY